MTDKQKIELLKKAFSSIAWMAIRYADGRHTAAPSTCRAAVMAFKALYPDWELIPDSSIKKPAELKKGAFMGDYLFDLFNKEKP